MGPTLVSIGECSEWTPGHSWTLCSSFKQLEKLLDLLKSDAFFFSTCNNARNGSREALNVNGRFLRVSDDDVPIFALGSDREKLRMSMVDSDDDVPIFALGSKPKETKKPSRRLRAFHGNREKFVQKQTRLDKAFRNESA